MMMPNARKCAVRLTLMFVTEKNIIGFTFSEQCLPQSRHSIYLLNKELCLYLLNTFVPIKF